VLCDLAGGWLADRFGPKRVLLVPWLLLSVLAVPAFLALSQSPTTTTLLSVSAALTSMHILGSSPAVLLFVQALPARIRAGATGFVYAVAVAFFGGTTQLFETLLIGWTGNPVVPGWYMAAAVLAGLTGAMLIPEPKRERATAGA
jgi:MHS family proline/betaine transporter-like MFS transporter